LNRVRGKSRNNNRVDSISPFATDFNGLVSADGGWSDDSKTGEGFDWQGRIRRRTTDNER